MKLRRILVLSASLLALSAPAKADPVVTPIVTSIIGATIFGSATAAAVATFVVSTALEFGAALGLAKIASLFEHSPDRAASLQQLQLGESPRQVIFGTMATGGRLLDAFNYGGSNKTDWEVRRIALCDHRADLVGFWVNNFYIPYTGDGTVPDVTGRLAFNGQLQIYFRPGTLIQVPPADLAAAGGYTAADNAAGVAEVWVAYKADKSDAKNPVWQGGRPQFKFLVRGKRCYDPRKDSTVAGGSGAHRWSDPTTWEYSENPIICRYNWARGIYAGDQVDQPQMLLLGRGLSDMEAPPERIIGWANLCDEEVAQRYLNAAMVQDANNGHDTIVLASAAGILNGTKITLSRGLANQEVVTVAPAGASGSGGAYTVYLTGNLAYDHLHNEVAEWESNPNNPAMRPRYAMSGILDSSQTFEQQEAMFAATCAGRLIQPEGGIEVEPGYTKAPVFVITDGDLVGKAPVAWSDFGSSGDRVNTVIPSFTDPSQLYQNQSAPVRRSLDDITADGGPKEETLQLDLVTVLSQAQELGEIERYSRRYERTCTIVLPPAYSGIEEGDWGVYTSQRRANGTPITWEVISYTIDAKRRTTVTMKEVSPAIFERDGMTDELPPTGGNLPSATPPDALIPQGVGVNPYTETGSTGRAQPGATVTFTPPGDAAVARFLVEYRVQGTTNSLFAYTDEVSDGTLSLPGLLPDTTYEWRYRYIGTSGAPTPWSEWDTFHTDDVKLSGPDYGDFTIDITKLTQPVQDLLGKVPQVEASTRSLLQTVEQNAQSIISLATAFQDQSVKIGSALVYANQELTKTITGGLKAEAQARLDLAALVEGIINGTTDTVLTARVTQLETATADLGTIRAQAAMALVLDAQLNTPDTGIAAQVSQTAQALAALEDTTTATSNQTTAVARFQGLQMDKLGETLLQILTTLQDQSKRMIGALAFVSSTFTATVTDGQSAYAKALAEVTAMMQDADASLSASIQSTDQASVTRDQALTDSLNTAFSYFGAGIDGSHTVAAKLATEETTRANADTALADRATALEATINTPGTGLSAVVGSHSTAIADLSANKAEASTVTTLSSRVDDHTTSIANLLDSVDGIQASWAVQIDSGGRVTGLVRLDGGASSSNFVVVASNAYFYDVNGAQPMFSLSGGVARFAIPLAAGTVNAANIIADNLIVKNHIQGGQITDFQGLSGPTAGISTSEVNPFGSGANIVISNADADTKVFVQFSGSFSRAGGTSPTCTFRIYRKSISGSDVLLGETPVGGSGIPEKAAFSVSAIDPTPLSNSDARYYCTAYLTGTTSAASYNNATFIAFAGHR